MQILTHPSPALKQHAQEVERFSDRELKSLVTAMARAMYDAPGVGLAATQVGVLRRVLVYDIDEGLVALCNPRIVSASEETTLSEEGCLSLPGIEVPVERAASVTCEASDIDGGPVTIEADGLLARVLQHEIDHLDGMLIIDRATPEERRAAIRRYNEVAHQLG
ncbi:MAG: peptide deformylase [Coriobacteriia bacterium]|nr:peptide deformylase [Coriobacteriia bacterium]